MKSYPPLIAGWLALTTLTPLNAFSPDRCANILERLVGPAIAQQWKINPGTPHPFGTDDTTIMGDSTKLLYSRDFAIKPGDQRLPFVLDFMFVPEKFERAARVPYLVLIPGLEAHSPHIIRINLARSAAGEPLDVNLVADAFAKLYRFAKRTDEFQFAISDPSLVRQFNQVIHVGLRQTGWTGAPSHLITTKSKNSDCRHIACFEDSLLVGIDRREFIERLAQSDHEALQGALMTLANQMVLIQQIRAESDWEMAITIQSVDSVIESDGQRVPAVLQKYIAVLRPAWD